MKDTLVFQVRKGHRPRRIGARVVVLVLIFLLSGFATGCVAPKRATNLVVPARCMKLRVENFTRPCAQQMDGKLVCDGVVVTANCVEVK